MTAARLGLATLAALGSGPIRASAWEAAGAVAGPPGRVPELEARLACQRGG